MAVSFDDPGANGSFVTVTLTVEDVVCALPTWQIPTTGTIQFRVFMDSSQELPVLQRGFRSIPRVLVFLRRGDPSIGAPEDTLSISWPGALFSPIADDGSLSFPGMGELWETTTSARSIQSMVSALPAPPLSRRPVQAHEA
ncbi:MAG: hypothetical protein ACR2KL_02570 [Nocardioidaceae bacterium]